MRALVGALGAADHEGERAGLRAADAAGNRRIDHEQLARGGGRSDGARGLDVDGRTIDQQRAGIGSGDDAGRVEIDLAHLLASRQHGDDDIGARRRDLC